MKEFNGSIGDISSDKTALVNIFGEDTWVNDDIEVGIQKKTGLVINLNKTHYGKVKPQKKGGYYTINFVHGGNPTSVKYKGIIRALFGLTEVNTRKYEITYKELGLGISPDNLDITYMNVDKDAKVVGNFIQDYKSKNNIAESPTISPIELTPIELETLPKEMLEDVDNSDKVYQCTNDEIYSNMLEANNKQNDINKAVSICRSILSASPSTDHKLLVKIYEELTKDTLNEDDLKAIMKKDGLVETLVYAKFNFRERFEKLESNLECYLSLEKYDQYSSLVTKLEELFDKFEQI